MIKALHYLTTQTKNFLLLNILIINVFYLSLSKTSNYYNDDEGYEEYDDNNVQLPGLHWGNSSYINKPEIHLFTDRYLYRPGEKVHVKGIVRYRNNDQWSLDAPNVPLHEIVFTIFNSRDEEIVTVKRPVSKTGGVECEIQLKDDYPTGYYRIEVQGKNKDYSLVKSITFQVEQFKPVKAEMKIIPQKLTYQWDEILAVDLFGWYLFGAPVNNDIEYSVSLIPIQYRSKAYPDYSFSTQLFYYDEYDEYSSSPTTIASGTIGVNDRGIGKVFVKLRKMSNVPNAEIFITARTKLSDNSPVFGAKSCLKVLEPVHVGIMVHNYFNDTQNPITIKLIAINNDDKVIDGNTVRVIVKRHEWKSFQIAGVNGRLQWEYKQVEKEVFNSVITIGKKDMLLSLKEPGYYTAEAYDKAGKRKYAVNSFYVIGAGEAGWRVNDDETIDIETNKTRYNVGDTAMLLVKNPFEKATAFVTVEREKFYNYFEMPANSSILMIPIKITEDHIPNIYVSVILYSGRTGFDKVKNGQDMAKPKCYIGYASLKVIPKEKELSIVVTSNKKQYQPGDMTTLTIQVNDYRGQPVEGEATISVADRGVLNLVNYTLPNPIDLFYQPRSLAVTTFDVRQIILGQRYLKEKGELIGGDGGIASMGMIIPRADIRFSAFYKATVPIVNGKAIVSFKLPDNLTSFKSMVVVHTNDSKFGYGDSTFEVKKPLMVIPTFPRFARIGDTFNAGAMVFNYTGKKDTVKVSVELSGGLKLQNGSTGMVKDVVLNNGESKEITFPITVNNADTAMYVVKAKAGNYTDGIKEAIAIKAPNIYETVALYGRITNPETKDVKEITITNSIIPEISSINIFASPSAFTDIKGSLDYLIEYPYGCLEQKSSKILPLILGQDIIVQKNLLKVKTKDDLKNLVSQIISEFPSYFNNGGFSYWKNSNYPSSYLSVYATFVLTMAKMRGYNIDAALFNSALATVKQFVKKGTIFSDEENWYYSSYKYTTLCFAHYVAALNGYYDEDQLKFMYSVIDSKADACSPAYAYLLKAVAQYPDTSFKKNMIRDISKKFFSRMRSESGYVYFKDTDEWGYFYYTNVISTSIILQAMLEAGVVFDNDYKVVNYLLKQRKGYAWLHTHENAMVWWALNTYLSKYEKGAPDYSMKVAMDAQNLLDEIVNNENASFAKSITLSKAHYGKHNISFTKQGQGILYYTLRYMYVPLYNDTHSKDMGFSITKTYRDCNTGNKVSTFTKGSEYIVEIVVYTPKERGITVLDDALPGGLEPVNITFATEEKKAKEDNSDSNWKWGTFNHNEQYNDKVVYYADYLKKGSHHVSYRVRATNTGTFKLPACKVEEMYNPEVFGILYYGNEIEIK